MLDPSNMNHKFTRVPSKFSLSISLMLQQLIIFFWHQQPIYAALGYIHFNGNRIFTIRGPFVSSNFQFFANFWVPDRDTENFIKYHLFIYKRSMLDQNLKGLAQKLGLPRPSQVQIEMGVAGSIFELRPPNFVKMHYVLLKMLKWYY